MLAGLWLYLRATKASTKTGKYGMGIFVLVLLLINAVNIFGPLQGDSKVVLAAMTLATYLLFAAVAQLNNKRHLVQTNDPAEPKQVLIAKSNWVP